MPERDDKAVFVALPTYDGRRTDHCMFGLLKCTAGKYKPVPAALPSSCLTKNFNRLWCDAIFSRCRYWAMLHDDIGPTPGWLDVLLAEQQRLGGVVSAVSPIKNQDGKVSCAVRYVNSDEAHYALSVDDVQKLPPTFNTADVNELGHDGLLLVNTGCWVADLSEHWVKKIWFDVENRIIWNTDNTARIISTSEDYFFSLKLHDLGVPVHATTKVGILHEGRGNWQLNLSEGQNTIP